MASCGSTRGRAATSRAPRCRSPHWRSAPTWPTDRQTSPLSGARTSPATIRRTTRTSRRPSRRSPTARSRQRARPATLLLLSTGPTSFASRRPRPSAPERLPRQPALVVTLLFEFQAAWTDLMRPLIYLRDSSTFTIPRGLKALLDQFGFGGEWHWEIVVTASVIA